MTSHKFFRPVTLVILLIFILLLIILGQFRGEKNYAYTPEINMLKVETVENCPARPAPDLGLLQQDLALIV